MKADVDGFARRPSCIVLIAHARELGISPQGLNSAMHRLEEELGVTLFDTAYGKGKLTPYGELFHRHALNVVDELSQVNRGIELLREHDRRIIKLGCSMGIMGYLGENALDEFNQGNADTQVLVSDELPDVECERRLLDGSYTFALLTRTTIKALPWGFSLCYRRDHALSETEEAAFLEYVRGKRREYI